MTCTCLPLTARNLVLKQKSYLLWISRLPVIPAVSERRAGAWHASVEIAISSFDNIC